MAKGKSSGRGRKRSVARKPRLNASRAPKKSRGSRRTASSWREASDSVFTRGSETPEGESRGRRLNQVLAAAGLGSRRQVEELILDGRVEIDGRVVTDLSVRVVPGEHKIKVDGEGLAKTRPTYVAFNKPKNTLCTNNDPSGRRRVVDFMPTEYGRLFTVGRLDQNSEGLILLTNDGALAERLTHPRFEVPKKYRVQVAGLVDSDLANALKRGVHIAEGVVQADEVVVRSRHKKSSVLEITLTEGKNREIRRMLARVGHKVMQLQRIQVGSIKLGKLAPGESRRLTSQEVADLYQMAETRPDAETLDVNALPPSLRPVEVTQLAEREQEKAERLENAKKPSKALRDAKPRANADPNFTDSTRKQFQRSQSYRDDDSYDEQPARGRRRAPKEEFREEFRSEERREERRRARRRFDDETRTIGPKVFSRDEGDSRRRDAFNEDASKRTNRGGKRGTSEETAFKRGSKKTARQPRPGKRGRASGRRGR
ncbi:MAG: rRNA pseudouridine synthase [Thermoguttaceae bacterium]|nr:rRNA pseudouridine synthase [Thermoguttaceae bacterium]